MKYTINEIPPSNNKFSGRKNVWQYREEKKRWSQLVNLMCRPKPDKPIEKATVTLVYYFKTKIRHDPDNYSGKFILDGLVQAGIIADDSFKNIDLHLHGYTDKDNPRTVIEVTERD